MIVSSTYGDPCVVPTWFICKCDSRRGNHTGYHETDTICPYMGIPRHGLNMDYIIEISIYGHKRDKDRINLQV